VSSVDIGNVRVGRSGELPEYSYGIMERCGGLLSDGKHDAERYGEKSLSIWHC